MKTVTREIRRHVLIVEIKGLRIKLNLDSEIESWGELKEEIRRGLGIDWESDQREEVIEW